MAYQQTTFGKRAFHKTSLSFLLLAAGALLLLVGPGGASAAACYRALPRSAFPHCQLLSPTFALHWRVDSDLASGNITLGLDADTGGELRGVGYVRWCHELTTVTSGAVREALPCCCLGEGHSCVGVGRRHGRGSPYVPGPELTCVDTCRYLPALCMVGILDGHGRAT